MCYFFVTKSLLASYIALKVCIILIYFLLDNTMKATSLNSIFFCFSSISVSFTANSFMSFILINVGLYPILSKIFLSVFTIISSELEYTTSTVKPLCSSFSINSKFSKLTLSFIESSKLSVFKFTNILSNSTNIHLLIQIYFLL